MSRLHVLSQLGLVCLAACSAPEAGQTSSVREASLSGSRPGVDGESPPLGDASPEPSSLDPETRRQVIEQLAAVLAAEYVFPELGAQLQSGLLDRLEQGAYDGIDRADDLAVTLTRDLRELAHDKHLGVRLRPPPPQPGVPPPIADTPQNGIRRLEILPGNVGYLALEGVPPLEIARAAIDGAFAILQQTEALILDNRDNHGGAPATVAYYASYLLEGEPFVITRIHHRADVIINEIWTVNLGRRSYGASRPVFVLTSSGTFSGGEGLTYDLQALGRAVVIGEVTGGGAHPVQVMPLGELFTVAVPFAQNINPITGGNWEGTGVQPDIPVPAAEALSEAHAVARAQVQQLRALRASQGLPPLRPGVLEARQETPRPFTRPNPIYNGDFSLGVEPWGVTNFQGEVRPYRIDGGVLCITLAPLDRVIVGWPLESSSYAAQLARGLSYQLSFKASASGALPVYADVTVGHRLPPYTPLVTAPIPAAEELLPFTVDFDPDFSDDQAGLAFHILAGQGSGTSEVCLDDVAVGGP